MGDDEGEIYEVEKIVGRDIIDGKEFFLVKWVGYDNPKDLTWEPIHHLDCCTDLIQEFWQEQVAIKEKNYERKLRRAKDTPKPPKSKKKKKSNEVKQKSDSKKSKIEIPEAFQYHSPGHYFEMQGPETIVLSKSNMDHGKPKWREFEQVHMPPGFGQEIKIKEIITDKSNNIYVITTNGTSKQKWKYDDFMMFFPDVLLNWIEIHELPKYAQNT